LQTSRKSAEDGNMNKKKKERRKEVKQENKGLLPLV
jgi:hypothetical protein